MTLEELKEKVEKKEDIQFPVVLVCKDLFLPEQYIKFMREVGPVEYTDRYVHVITNLFGLKDDTVKVLKIEELNTPVDGLYIILCKSISKELEKTIDYIKVPDLSDWMIEDYVYSKLEGVDKKNIEWLISICKHDIYRLDEEMDKLLIFEPVQRNILFNKFKEDGVFSDLSDKNIFTMSTAIQKKDTETIYQVYHELLTASTAVDVEPLGLYTILYNNFQKMIKVWLNKQPNPENTGLQSKQIWAINNLPKVYTKEQLIKIYEMLTSIDSGFKSGTFPIDILLDYLVVKCLVI
jgi:hypothetical protein